MAYRIIKLKNYTDRRGTLIPMEARGKIPFAIKRVFFIKKMHPSRFRANHANMKSNQAIFLVQGRCKVQVRDGNGVDAVIPLTNSEQFLFISKGTWRKVFASSRNCILAVFSDQCYRKDDYIFDYGTFLKIAGKAKKKSLR